MRYPALGSRTFLLLVLPDKGEAQDQEDTELEAVGNEKRSDAELILGRLFRKVEERRDDVADTCAWGGNVISIITVFEISYCAPNQIIPDTIIFFDWPGINH